MTIKEFKENKLEMRNKEKMIMDKNKEKEFKRMAASVGVTPGELVECFMNELSLRYTAAVDWLRQSELKGCELQRGTFVQYLYIEEDSAEEFLKSYYEMLETESTIKKLKEDIENPNYNYKGAICGEEQVYKTREEFVDATKKEILQKESYFEFVRDSVMETWNNYIEWSERDDLSLNEEVKKIEAWENSAKLIFEVLN